MKRTLIGLAALPLFAGGAAAADRLSDAQMDGVTAGLAITCFTCGSSGQISTSTSSTIDGATTSSSSTVTFGNNPGSGGSTGGGGSPVPPSGNTPTSNFVGVPQLPPGLPEIRNTSSPFV